MQEKKQETQNTQKRLELTNDYVFKRIFAKPKNNQELKEFVEAILDIKIKKIEVKNPEITKNYTDEKLGILDIRATIDDDKILDVEMQVSNIYTFVNRNIGYGARLIAEDTRVSETYEGLKKFISINILVENLLKRNTYHSIVHLKFDNNNPKKYVDMGYKEEQEILTDKIEIHYIELQKFIKSKPGMNSKLEQWLWLLTGEDEKIKMASEENKTIEKVVEDLDEMSADENERIEAFKRKLAIWDYNTTMEESEKKGKEEGQKTEKLEIAKKMKEKGMAVEDIIEITGLTKEEIESL